jgi:triphosphoribosyl-dephospho-CoA synthase
MTIDLRENVRTSACAQHACILEATARKAGNVHRYADFDDLSYLDLILSATALPPALAGMIRLGLDRQCIGMTVRLIVAATRRVVRTNTNLGIALLLTPLAAVPWETRLIEGIRPLLAGLTVNDAQHVYKAIRLANPGGLGQVDREDVANQPTQTLLEVMKLAAHRDGVARQYAHGFCDVFEIGVPALRKALERGATVEDAIIICQLELMATLPDTLIARKRGQAEAVESATRARQVLDAGGLDSEAGVAAFCSLDQWLRAKGHSRNPGTTADLVTASLFAVLREGTMKWPCDRPFTSSRLPCPNASRSV